MQIYNRCWAIFWALLPFILLFCILWSTYGVGPAIGLFVFAIIGVVFVFTCVNTAWRLWNE